MALVLRYVDDLHTLFNKHGDSRTANFPLMSSPFYTAAICLSYVYIVKVLGPKLMENRKPFQLKNALIAYNLFQVVFSFWLFYESGMAGWFGHYSFRCQPVDHSNSEQARRIGMSGWLTGRYNFRCQPVDYSNNPMTLRCMLIQFTVSGGHSTFFGFLNTFVHIVMYSYYLLAAFGPHMQKYLWWKKYLTTLQMIQFVLIMLHAFQLLFIDCNYPRAFVWWIGMHAVMFFFLFKDFYNQAYNSKKRKMEAKAAAAAAAAAITSNGKNSEQQKQQNGYTKQNGAGVKNASEYYSNGHISEAYLRTSKVQ
ncbi:elongation of very long chain fatty acids protein AAEL008004 [Agrilus planipennis]|uniref:Elongation of very long chain fatty acids protein n=1 Tax=Agrilus planipennis TaxID=224129 RepID=A0A7F5RAD3_AGRPL|nr:elongation of very long chain fatty acids protein AAEL008004 [Agrilus planipennis]